MKEVNNNKQRNMFIFGLVSLLILVLGASYAYFAVNTVNNFGTSTINAQAGNIGSVTLNGTNASLSMSLSAVDMVQGNSDVTYYASSSGKTTTPTTVTLGTATVNPTSDTNLYHCTYTLNVTHTGTRDMYTIFNSKTNNTYNYADRSTNQIILTINDTDYDFYNGWPENNRYSGDFYIKGNQTRYITASFKFINVSNKNQNYLAGSDINISLSLNSFSCTALSYIARNGTDELTGLPVVRIGEEEFYDITNAINYSSLVSTNGNIYNYANGKSILFAKYQLSKTTGLQTSSSYCSDCTVPFSGDYYWLDSLTDEVKPQYGTASASNIYDSTHNATPNYSVGFRGNAGNLNYSIAYYVEAYINTLGINATGRLLTYTEADALMNNYYAAVVNGQWYWLGSASLDDYVYAITESLGISHSCYETNIDGARPVIIMNTSDIPS